MQLCSQFLTSQLCTFLSLVHALYPKLSSTRDRHVSVFLDHFGVEIVIEKPINDTKESSCGRLYMQVKYLTEDLSYTLSDQAFFIYIH
jgi:hypothetical protein